MLLAVSQNDNWDMIHSLRYFLRTHKYEVLLFALLQHLFIGIFLQDLPFYSKIIWPINMVVLGVASIGVFIEKSRRKTTIKNILFLLTLALPISLPYAESIPYFMLILNLTYVAFYVFIFSEILKFLIKPGYINADIISASGCGYLLLVEISVFLFQFFYYKNPDSFKGIDTTSMAVIYMDFVYFCTITLTSIGYGDISPNLYYTKLITAFIGILGQFYSVVLVGILISKFSSKSDIPTAGKP